MDYQNINLGNRFKALFKKRAMNQKEIAEKIDRTQSNVSSLLSNPNLRAAQILTLMHVGEIAPSELFPEFKHLECKEAKADILKLKAQILDFHTEKQALIKALNAALQGDTPTVKAIKGSEALQKDSLQILNQVLEKLG